MNKKCDLMMKYLSMFPYMSYPKVKEIQPKTIEQDIEVYIEVHP